jgi:hypothetical protein
MTTRVAQTARALLLASPLVTAACRSVDLPEPWRPGHYQVASAPLHDCPMESVSVVVPVGASTVDVVRDIQERDLCLAAQMLTQLAAYTGHSDAPTPPTHGRLIWAYAVNPPWVAARAAGSMVVDGDSILAQRAHRLVASADRLEYEYAVAPPVPEDRRLTWYERSPIVPPVPWPGRREDSFHPGSSVDDSSRPPWQIDGTSLQRPGEARLDDSPLVTCSRAFADTWPAERFAISGRDDSYTEDDACLAMTLVRIWADAAPPGASTLSPLDGHRIVTFTFLPRDRGNLLLEASVTGKPRRYQLKASPDWHAFSFATVSHADPVPAR